MRVLRRLKQPGILFVLTSAPTYVATSEMLREVEPMDLTPLRFFSATLILGLLMIVRRGRPRPRLSTGDRWRVFAISLLGYALYGTLINIGQTTMAAGTTSLLLNMSPVFAFILGTTVLRERPTRKGVLGISVAVLGTAVVTFGNPGGLSFDWNALVIVAASLVLAVFLVLQQPMFARVDPVELVFWGCLTGAILTLPIAPLHLAPASWPARTWIALLFLVTCGTALGYAFWNLSLAASSVSAGGALLFAVPVLSVALGLLLLHQVPTLGAVVGGVISLAGVLLLDSPKPGDPPDPVDPEGAVDAVITQDGTLGDTRHRRVRPLDEAARHLQVTSMSGFVFWALEGQRGTCPAAEPGFGRSAAPVLAGMLAGADSIDDLDVLRHGAMGKLFGGVRAPS